MDHGRDAPRRRDFVLSPLRARASARTNAVVARSAIRLARVVNVARDDAPSDDDDDGGDGGIARERARAMGDEREWEKRFSRARARANAREGEGEGERARRRGERR